MLASLGATESTTISSNTFKSSNFAGLRDLRLLRQVPHEEAMKKGTKGIQTSPSTSTMLNGSDPYPSSMSNEIAKLFGIHVSSLQNTILWKLSKLSWDIQELSWPGEFSKQSQLLYQD